MLVYQYDCILRDINLPGGSGLDLLQTHKQQNKTESVIIISAKAALDDKVFGLESGADEYLAERHARIKSVLGRGKFQHHFT